MKTAIGSTLEGKVILWVEDDTTLRDFVAKRMVQEQCIILHAGHGGEALQFIAAQKPDLIILDIQMPGMDGFEILSRIKADEETKNIPVIMLSNLDDSGTIKKALEMGAAGFLVKAIETPASIVEKMSAVLVRGETLPIPPVTSAI